LNAGFLLSKQGHTDRYTSSRLGGLGRARRFLTIQLTSMASDILSIPAMSAETERVFSDTKLKISPNQNRLGEDIIEAIEGLNRWYRAGI
jgi:hAT family C-terminal dimerisation region